MMNMTSISDPRFTGFLEAILRGKPQYALPGNPLTDTYILGCSGGVDSSVLAILLHALYPHINFRLVFTDTKAEDEEAYESLTRLEKFLGKNIERISPEKGLWELIDQYNGFLPSGQQRYCTRELKLVPFKAWMRQFENQHKIMLVGIRADESDRVAFTIDDCDTEMPFVDMDLRRNEVFQIMAETIGIPRFYQHRTRSGCTVCMFQRRSELVGLYQYQKIEFHRGMRVEKVSQANIELHVPAVPLWKDTGIALNWQSLPFPEKAEVMVGKRVKETTFDLFGNRGIFVGGEFFFDGLLSYDEFCFHQRVISYSPTLAGIKQQINDRYKHLLATSEVFDMTNEDIQRKARFAIWYVELPYSHFFPQAPASESFTWQRGASYGQIEHIVSWITRALHAHQLQVQATMTVRPNTIEEEWKECAVNSLKKITEPIGQISNSVWYVPKVEEPEELTDEELLLTTACPMCSMG